MATSLDFIITDTNDCRTMAVEDTSMYEDGFTISEPKIIVYIPGRDTAVTFGFVPKKKNIINSNLLGITAATDHTGLTNLPDGIYKVTLTVKPSATYSVEKTFLRTCNLQSRFEGALLKFDSSDCNDEERKYRQQKLIDIEFLIMSAVAQANRCNNAKAVKLYTLADEEIKRLEKRFL